MRKDSAECQGAEYGHRIPPCQRGICQLGFYVLCLRFHMLARTTAAVYKAILESCTKRSTLLHGYGHAISAVEGSKQIRLQVAKALFGDAIRCCLIHQISSGWMTNVCCRDQQGSTGSSHCFKQHSPCSYKADEHLSVSPMQQLLRASGSICCIIPSASFVFVPLSTWQHEVFNGRWLVKGNHRRWGCCSWHLPRTNCRHWRRIVAIVKAHAAIQVMAS